MHIAVISDTHVPDKYETLSQRLLQNLAGCDLILHCGDITQPEVLAELARFAPVEAVAGNHDVKYLGDILPRKKVLNLKGYKIGMIHGDQYEGEHIKRVDLINHYRKVVVEPFIFGEPLDLIIFGHFHQPILDSIKVEFSAFENYGIVTRKNVALLNPGIPIRNKGLASMGFINIEEASLNITIKVFRQ